MDPACQAVLPPDVSDKQLSADLQAFPSPASISGSLDTPTLGNTIAGSEASAHCTPQNLLTGDAEIVAAVPGAVSIEPAMTPPLTGVPQPDMNIIVGGALAPVHTALPDHPQPKAGPSLRLPSFEALGIATPHPDRFGQSGLDGALTEPPRESMKEYLGTTVEDFELIDIFDRLGGGQSSPHADAGPSKASGRAVQGPFHHFVATLTPPAEGGDMDWQSIAKVSTAAMPSPSTDLGTAAIRVEDTQPGPDVSASGIGSNVVTDGLSVDESKAWVDGAVQALGKCRTNCISAHADPRSREPAKCTFTKQSAASPISRATQSFTDRAHLP